MDFSRVTSWNRIHEPFTFQNTGSPPIYLEKRVRGVKGSRVQVQELSVQFANETIDNLKWSAFIFLPYPSAIFKGIVTAAPVI